MNETISYEKELTFLKYCLEYHNIFYHTYHMKEPAQPFGDLGIRDTIGLPPQNLDNLKNFIIENLKENTLCYFTDEFTCHYIVFILPETTPSNVFVIGPYITIDEKETLLEHLSQSTSATPWISILKNYYLKICSLPNEEVLNALVNALAEAVWGRENYSMEHFINGLSETASALAALPDPQRGPDIFSNIEVIESVYLGENELVNAIAHGQSAKARAIFSNIPLNSFKYELEPLRNLKNFSIIINTLFRKAAEQGGVHPLYVDQLSSAFTIRIEAISRSDNVFDLWTDMIQKYCTLVNNHNTKNYSLPIQRVITRINFDITADLSLKATAEFLNVNASYLSNLFRKETGYTLTNYVNKKRMEHAAFLLLTTALPISTIAQQCGILDDNYFTKLFKRHYQVSPSQFREHVPDDVAKYL